MTCDASIRGSASPPHQADKPAWCPSVIMRRTVPPGIPRRRCHAQVPERRCVRNRSLSGVPLKHHQPGPAPARTQYKRRSAKQTATVPVSRPGSAPRDEQRTKAALSHRSTLRQVKSAVECAELPTSRSGEGAGPTGGPGVCAEAGRADSTHRTAALGCRAAAQRDLVAALRSFTRCWKDATTSVNST